MIKLYWAPQTRSLKALWLLEETGLAYERVPVDIRAGEQASEAFRAINPMMKVPALTDGPVKVAESGAIAAYLAERAPDLAPPPGDPQRGDFWRWLFFSGNCIEAAYAEKFSGMSLRESAAGWGSYGRVMDVLDQALTDGPWLLGARFTLADVVIASDLRFGVDVFKMVEARPSFRAYIDRATARPAFARALAIETAAR